MPDECDHRKHAEIIADHLVDWIREKDLQDGIKAIGGDSTNVNTGWSGGVMRWVEEKLGRRLVWIVCVLHTGELPLRHLIIELDTVLPKVTISGPALWERCLIQLLNLRSILISQKSQLDHPLLKSARMSSRI